MSTQVDRGAFVLSLDLELLWGVRHRRTIEDYGPNVLGVRHVVPRLLTMFETHQIACTWAAVGFLFFDEKDALLASLPTRRPTYADRTLCPYAVMEQVGPDERRDPYHFGLSLIRQIQKRPRQEIASHTFSHYMTLEAGQTEEQFSADLDAAVAAAAAEKVTFESIVFPRNQVNPAYFRACRARGMRFYRGNEAHRMYEGQAAKADPTWRRFMRALDACTNISGHNASLPNLHEGMVNIRSSRLLRPYSRSFSCLQPLIRRRIVDAMRCAAKESLVFHLWFHPHNFGVDQEENFAFLESIVREAVALRERFGWRSRTMHEVGLDHQTLHPVVPTSPGAVQAQAHLTMS